MRALRLSCFFSCHMESHKENYIGICIATNFLDAYFITLTDSVLNDQHR